MELFYTIPAVVGLGALHSLEPGHGKGVITAYLISSGGKLKDAVLIGIISALAHTLSICLLAFSASSTIKILLPENLTYWFQILSGTIVIYIGLNMIIQRIFPNKMVINSKHDSLIHKHVSFSSHKNDHQCDHHECNHNHIHLSPNTSSSPLLNLFLMGFFTGLVPCPSALAILLTAISADKIPSGLGLVGAFSVGSAITMVMIGLLVIRASDSIKHLEKWHIMNRLALVSSFLILVLGVAVILQSINHVGITPTF